MNSPEYADYPEEPAVYPPGHVFGNYVIRGPIGRGGMARVYRAEHVALNKQVALKVMDSSLQDRSAGQRRFLREGQAAAAVKHPNVVDITDVGVWQGVPYLVMELLQGQDLANHLRGRGALPDSELVRLALPIIAGLAAAHDAGVVHRDLKPSNIFLARGADGDVVPKLLDFGISKLVCSLQPDLHATPFGEVMGTPLYMPPEALDGSRELSARSDQYSLGVVLYECATGRPPIHGDTLISLLQRVAAAEYAPPSSFRIDISANLERAILRAMSRRPTDRFPHIRDFGRALWENASPRTQLVWERSFAASPSPELRGRGSRVESGTVSTGARLVLRAPQTPAPFHRPELIDMSQASTRRIGGSRGSRAAGALLAIAAALAVLVLAWAYASKGPTNGRAQAVAVHHNPLPLTAAPAGVSPASVAPAGALPSPTASPRAVSQETGSLRERPAGDRPGEGAPRRDRAGAEEAAAIHPITAASDRVFSERGAHRHRTRVRIEKAETAPSSQPGSPAAAAEDEEFPGLRPSRSEQHPAPASHPAPVGANGSPLLD